MGLISFFFFFSEGLDNFKRSPYRDSNILRPHPYLSCIAIAWHSHETLHVATQSHFADWPMTATHNSEVINTYCRGNTTDDVSLLSIWETHKCVVLGKWISLASQRKKDPEKELRSLIDKISKLETQHKRSVAVQSASELLTARTELQAKLDLEAKRILFLKRGFFTVMAIKAINS